MAEQPQFTEPLIVQLHPFRADILRCYMQNLDKIRNAARLFRNGNSTYNFELLNQRPVSATDLNRNIYANQRHAFRFNAAFGYILFNHRKLTCRWYYPCFSNGGIWEATPYIYNRQDWNTIVDHLSSDDLMDKIGETRESTEETVVWVTNVRCWVFANHAQVLA